jgi:hypothetical protein
MIWPTHKRNDRVWHPWFAWFPVRIDWVDKGTTHETTWMWLRMVERKWCPGGYMDLGGYTYRRGKFSLSWEWEKEK